MLTQDQFINSIKFQSLQETVNIFISAKSWHMLYEHDTGRVICTSPWHATMLTMQSITLNSVPLWWMNSAISKVPKTFNNTRPWQLIWNPNTQTFKIDADPMAHDQLYRYNLLAEKAALLDQVNQRIYNHRRFLWNDQLMQPTVYHMKYISACDLLEHPEPDSAPTKWPMVYDYAELAGLSLRAAAEEIVFQYRLWETRISNTETLRLRTNRVIEASKDLTELKNILDSFIAESDIYGKM